MVSSVAVACVPLASVLITARVTQGVGAAIIAPATLALITEFSPEGPERLKATSAYGAVAGIGVAVGMVLGGIFTEVWSWRVGFIINVPMGLLLLYLVHRTLPSRSVRTGSLDVLGALSSTVGIAAVLYAIVLSADSGWSNPMVIVSLALGIALFAWFIYHESRAQHPLLPLHLFNNTQRNAILASRFLLVGSVMSFFFFATQVLQDSLGYNALQAGFSFVPLSLVQFATAKLSPKFAARGVSEAFLVVGGLLMMVGGMAFLAFAPLWGLWAGLVLVGAGQGFAFGTMTSAAIQHAHSKDAGAVSGLVNSVHQIGGTFGVGVFSALAVTIIGQSEGANMVIERAHFGFTLSMVCLLAAAALACTMFMHASNLGNFSEQQRPSSGRHQQILQEEQTT